MVKLKNLRKTIDLNDTRDEELVKDIKINLIRTGYLPSSSGIDLNGIVDFDTLNAFAIFKKDNFMTDGLLTYANLVGPGSAKVLIKLPTIIRYASEIPSNESG